MTNGAVRPLATDAVERATKREGRHGPKPSRPGDDTGARGTSDVRAGLFGGNVEDRDEWRREPHLERLVLNPDARTWPSYPLGGPEYSGGRASIHGLNVMSRAAASPRPIISPRVGPRGEPLRDIPKDRRWSLIHGANTPITDAPNVIWTAPVINLGLGDYGRIPEITAACDEWVTKGVNLREFNPAVEATLSPLSFLLLWGYRKVTELEEVEDPRVLLEERPYVMREVLFRLMARDPDGLPIARRSVIVDEYMEGGAQLFDALARAYRTLGIQVPLSNAYLPVELNDPSTPLTREEYLLLRDRHPEILDEFVRASGLPERLEAIDAASRIIPQRAFEGVHAVCVQHVLATQVPLFAAMEAHGLDPSKTEIIGVPYSTNYVTQHALERRGYRIHTPLVVDPNDVARVVEEALVPALARALERSERDGGAILVLDDGGKATTVIHKYFGESADRFRVVEQTRRGIRDVLALEASSLLRTRVVDVAQAWMKAHESLKIGREVLDQCFSLMGRINMADSPLGAEVGILGAGTIGLGVARAALERGCRVTLFDPALLTNDEARLCLEAEGFILARSKPEVLRNKTLIIGCAGERTIETADLEHVSHHTAIASASSRDIEIDLSPNRSRQITSVPLLAEGPGDTRFVTRVWRLPDKDIVVLRNGFPVNFNGRLETSTFESIALTRAIMLLGAAQSLEDRGTGCVPLSLVWQDRLAEALHIDRPRRN